MPIITQEDYENQNTGQTEPQQREELNNLFRKVMGDKYRYVKNKDDGFLEIPLRKMGLDGHGHIYLHSKTHLGIYVERERIKKTLTKLLKKIPSATVHNDGDYEFIVLVPFEDAQLAAEVTGARIKRKMTEEEKKQCGERLKDYQYKPGESGRKL